jgi:hypothetical protein
VSLAAGAGLEAAERAIRAAVLELGRAVLEPLLAADAGYRGPRADCGHGHQAGFVSCRGKTIDTVLGPVTLRRAWYHCAECGHGLAPRDAGLGVAGDTMSPGLARMTGRAAAVVIEAGAAAVAARQVVPMPAAGPAPDMLYICIEGTGVPVIAAETEGRDGKAEDGKASTREARLCCAFTQTAVDEKGRPVRDPRSSSYLITFEPAASPSSPPRTSAY